MLSRDGLPPLETVLSFGAKHNASVWEKHRAYLSSRSLDGSSAFAALDTLRAVDGQKISRRQVFEIADQDTAAGVVAAIVWGFPRGGLQGGKWQPFAAAFGNADLYARVIERARREGGSATRTLEELNAIQPGVGFATTSKIAYFARLGFAEGQALIFDRNVILAIRAADDPSFQRTRAALGSGAAFYHRGTASYGAFISEAAAMAQGWGVDPVQIETGLFQLLANPRSGWH